MRKLISVTQCHIDNGVRGSTIFCAVALAIRDDIKNIVNLIPYIPVHVYKNMIEVNNNTMITSKKLEKFIQYFDEDKLVKPFKFLLHWREK